LSIRTYHPRYLYLRQPLLLGEVIGEIRRQTRSI